jgi:hypothetical protein
MGVYIEATSGATKGGCEDINLRGAFHGLGPGGVCHIIDGKGALGFTDIVISEAHSNNATGTVVKFETSGSGAISNVHIDALHIANYVPTDANQDAIIFDGDIDEFSINTVSLDGKSGATYLARRVVYDNTAGTKKGRIGPDIWGDVNTSVVVRTNAGTTAGRYNWARTDGTPLGAWASATDVIFGRTSSGAGPAEEVTFTDQAQQLADDTSFRAMCGTLGAWYVLAQSSVAQAHTGDLVETTKATVTIPANAMGANGRVRVTSVWSATNNANNKTLRVKFGGTNYLAQNITTTQSFIHQAQIGNRNSASSQVGTGNTAFGSAGQAISTSAVNTGSSVDITFTIQLANAGDTATLESYIVELYYAA